MDYFKKSKLQKPKGGNRISPVSISSSYICCGELVTVLYYVCVSVWGFLLCGWRESGMGEEAKTVGRGENGTGSSLENKIRLSHFEGNWKARRPTMGAYQNRTDSR